MWSPRDTRHGNNRQAVRDEQRDGGSNVTCLAKRVPELVSSQQRIRKFLGNRLVGAHPR
jgi:hypothetical protein